MITIKEANTKALVADYVKFPFSLYKNHPYWVPPLIQEEIDSFDKNKNPAFETAQVTLYLAYKDDSIVGRIAAIINWDEVNKQGKRKVRFGWWDVIDDIEVTKALLEKVYELGHKNNLEYIEGPMGFSNLDKVGVLTEGYDEMGSMITWYNYPYYKTHLEQLGYVKEKEYIESKFPFENVKPKAKIQKLKLPNRLIEVVYQENSKTTLLVTLNEGWQISFRIHNASSRIEPSLKFDINLVSAPHSLFSNQLFIG